MLRKDRCVADARSARSERYRRRPRSRRASIPCTSMRCRTSTGASSAGSWPGARGWIIPRAGRSPSPPRFSPSPFRSPQVPHIIFFFNILIVWVMLWIEARRYRFYDAFRARVRMLEAHFLVPIVSRNTSLLQGDWQKLVCEDLLLPSFKISRFEAVGRRREAQLRLHLHDHPRRVADENLPARASGSDTIPNVAHRIAADLLPRAAGRQLDPELARGGALRRHVSDLCISTTVIYVSRQGQRRDFRVWRASLALAALGA